jgi:mono/diheme cytochrome c family protein
MTNRIRAGAFAASLAAVAALLAGCAKPPLPGSPQDELIARGRDLFFNETFGGNGRTCGTCHPASNNFTIDPAFIAKLPPNDPLFVAEFVPALKTGFESPRLMREFGLIRENLDGFGDLDRKFVMRGVPHVLAMRVSIDSPAGPRTGWSGDGAPGDGSLRSFATGAVIQHFTKTLNRIPGVDFRLPTNAELDALEAFQLSLGRQNDLQLPLPLKGPLAKRGQEIFMDNSLGKCNVCHSNAGAITRAGQANLGNANFNTGVEDLPDQPAKLSGELVPADDGLGTPGDKTFNTPPLVEAADTAPFFHNNSVATLEGAVGFYDGDAFNESPAGLFLKSIDPNKKGIEIDATQIQAITAFLRVLNAIENMRQTTTLLDETLMNPPPRRETPRELLARARLLLEGAQRVLAQGGSGGLAGQAASARLNTALGLIARAADYREPPRATIDEALAAVKAARAELMVMQ